MIACSSVVFSRVRLFVAAGVAFVAVSVMLAGIARAQAAPIAISSCDVVKVYGGYGMGALTINGKGYNFFKVSFANNGAATADKITFQIEFSKSLYVIGDAGSFAPGSVTTHTLRDTGRDVVASARPGGSGPIACSVVSAHFTDGTNWAAPLVPVPSPSPSP